uniref:Uncharacterized protein n=1 Tax=Amphimedon queenslandica TaxID=400682 RepID=A0A1X7T7B7_AMPQE
MAENIEETVKVHVEDKTERDVLTGDFIRKRPKPATAYAEVALQEDQSAHQETEEQTDPPEQKVTGRSVWDRLGKAKGEKNLLVKYIYMNDHGYFFSL